MLRKVIVVFAVVIVFADATEVHQCEIDIPPLRYKEITISGCEEPVCILKQGTNISIEFEFVSSRTIQSLTNKLRAKILSISLYIDETNACDNIYKDGTKVSCPLEKDVVYTYKNSFYVSPMYPKAPITLKYVLQEGSEEAICFEVSAKITE